MTTIPMRLALAAAVAVAAVGGAATGLPGEASAQSVSQERQRMQLDRSRGSVDRAASATERSLQRSNRDVTDRTMRLNENMRIEGRLQQQRLQTAPVGGGVHNTLR